MGLEYVNRQDDRYYLLQGTTKTGKPTYYVSKKLRAGDVPVDEMPEGFEFYEQPRGGIVSVRRIKPSTILAQEKSQLEAWVRQLAGIEQFIVEVKDDTLIVYTPGQSVESAQKLVHRLSGGFGLPGRTAVNVSWLLQHSSYSAMLRFTLVDEDARLFNAERWCFRGSVDDWISLMGGRQTLEKQARKYLPHLAKESFFDMM